MKAVATNKLESDQLSLAPTGRKLFDQPLAQNVLFDLSCETSSSSSSLFPASQDTEFLFLSFRCLFLLLPLFGLSNFFLPALPWIIRHSKTREFGSSSRWLFTLFTRRIVSPTTVSKPPITSYSSQSRETKSKCCLLLN